MRVAVRAVPQRMFEAELMIALISRCAERNVSSTRGSKCEPRAGRDQLAVAAHPLNVGTGLVVPELSRAGQTANRLLARAAKRRLYLLLGANVVHQPLQVIQTAIVAPDHERFVPDPYQAAI